MAILGHLEVIGTRPQNNTTPPPKLLTKGGVNRKCRFFVPKFSKSVDFLYPDFFPKMTFLAFFLNNFFQSSKQKNFRGDFLKKSRFIAFFFNNFSEILLKFLLRRRRHRKKFFLALRAKKWTFFVLLVPLHPLPFFRKVDIFCTISPPPLLPHPPDASLIYIYIYIYISGML